MKMAVSSSETVVALYLTTRRHMQEYNVFYVHGTVHLSNTSHINTNEMQLFLFSFIWC